MALLSMHADACHLAYGQGMMLALLLSCQSELPGMTVLGAASMTIDTEIVSVARVEWLQHHRAQASWVEYRVDDVWWSTPPFATEKGTHSQVLLGIPFDHDFQWRVVAIGDTGKTTTETVWGHTGPVPMGMPALVVDVAEPDLWERSTPFLLTSVSESNPMLNGDVAFWTVMVDRQGRYVWAWPSPSDTWTLFAKPSVDGNAILMDASTFWTKLVTQGADGRVERRTLDGTLQRSWDTPGLHHAFSDLDEQTLLWMGRDGPDDLLWRVGNGDAQIQWSCMDWLVSEGIVVGEGGEEYCGTNSLRWYPPTGAIVLSLFSHEILLELDDEALGVRWFSGSNFSGYETDRPWLWQHEAHLIGESRLLISSGVRQGNVEPPEQFTATAVVEYEIDHDAGVLREAWSYESHDWISNYKGGAQRLEGGNTVHYYGDHFGLREVTPDGEVAWQIQPESDAGAWIGRSHLVGDLYRFLGEEALDTGTVDR